MSPIMRGVACAILACGMMLLSTGCGDPASTAFDADRGKHAAGWLPGEHPLAVTIGTTSMGAPVYSTEQCTECHGTALDGGIAGISCTTCHLGGPTSVHPSSWDPIYLSHGPSASAGGTASCANQYCHGTTLTGVANSGPACTTCHSLPFDPLTVTCGACHSLPPDGSRFPDIAGKHAKHATSATTSCNICHDGASTYVGDHHNNEINFSFLAAYTPKTGLTPTINTTAKTCANISCHGGQTTPSWYTGSINVNTQCTSCHAVGTVQYNGASSGEHDKHVNGENIACTTCHDTTALAGGHFARLDTSAMEGPASATLRTQTRYNGTSCNPSQGGLSGCHSSKTW